MEKCAFDKGYDCSALVHKQCQSCPFYKTAEQLEQERRASVERLIRLDKIDKIDKIDYYIVRYNLKAR